MAWERDCPLPVAPAATPLARHTSATGAQHAARRRGRLSLLYLELLAPVGPLSDHEAAGILGVGLSSINSKAYDVTRLAALRELWPVSPL